MENDTPVGINFDPADVHASGLDRLDGASKV